MTDGPTSGRFDGREHVLAVRVYYEDTDFTGRVYHASYVRFFERGRSDFLRTTGMDHGAMAALGGAFVVLRLDVRFLATAVVDDLLEVRTAFDAARGARLHVRQQILRAAAPVARAEVEVACIDLAGRAHRPPAALLAALEPYLDPDPASVPAARRGRG